MCPCLHELHESSITPAYSFLCIFLPGTYSGYSDVGCIDCPAGYYSEEASDACKQCEPGTYADTAGTDVCPSCPVGYATSNVYGNTECYICPEGKRDTWSRINCYSCWYGTYSVGTGNADCSSCPTGTYQDARTQNSCKDCAIGTYAHETSTRYCVACESGRYGSTTGLSDCTNCTAGQYSISVSVFLWSRLVSYLLVNL